MEFIEINHDLRSALEAAITVALLCGLTREQILALSKESP